MKEEEVKELIDYLWYEELRDYQRHLFETCGETVLGQFDNLDLENQDEISFWLSTEYCADHIFMTLLKLKQEINGK